MGMPAIRLNGLDISVGHGWPPTPVITLMPPAQLRTVFINSFPAVRVGDLYAPHTKGDETHANRLAITGSPTVFIQGLPAHRVLDAISCGDLAAIGSPTVFIG